MLATLNYRQFLAPQKLVAFAAPAFILIVLSMMVLPLPPFLLDLFFTFNIAMAIMVMLVAMHTKKPLDFSIFPTVLLVTTLLRLALNVASTRVVLLEGHQGADAAGKVIEAFGQFLVGGNTVIGVVVFVILVIINFMVVTKGAGRIAEVGARFTLDAMPGKQMAIDADLNAGLIDEKTAKARRAEVSQESEFYGSMDGASKFVSGDAIAGIIILFINVLGGLVVGVIQHGMPIGEAIEVYTILTIGDGLVAQIPALIISVSAGMMVSRVGDGRSMGAQINSQLLTEPKTFFLTAVIIGLLGLIPGMPNLVFVLLASGFAYLGWRLRQRALAPAPVAVEPTEADVAAKNEVTDASWDDVLAVDTLGLEVGYRLITLVDRKQDSELVKRIMGIRKKFARDVGFLVAPVRIRDNLNLKPNGYSIIFKGVEVAKGEVIPGKLMAIDSGNASGALAGKPTKEPAFQLNAYWIDPAQRDQATAQSYTVVDPAAVIATHINQVILTHAGELLGREEAQALLDHVAKQSKKLVEDVVPTLLSLSVVHKVFQHLLNEGVNLRDMKTILEILAEHAARTQDPVELTARVRQGMGRAIVNALFPGDAEIEVFALEPALERIFNQMAQSGSAALEPGLAEGFVSQVVETAQAQDVKGIVPVLLAPPQLRWILANFLRSNVPMLKVLSNAEIPENRKIRVIGMIGS